MLAYKLRQQYIVK